MKTLISIVCVSLMAATMSCDMRSGIAKDEMEKFDTKPTPMAEPTAEETPIAPEDVLTVDTSVEGDPISVNARGEKKRANCPKFNRMRVNGSNNTLTITGACSQIMVNGDRNEITSDGTLEFVFNGSNNVVKYLRFVNGRRPVVTENGPDNSAEKISAGAVTDNKGNRKIVK